MFFSSIGNHSGLCMTQFQETVFDQRGFWAAFLFPGQSFRPWRNESCRPLGSLGPGKGKGYQRLAEIGARRDHSVENMSNKAS